MFYYDTELQYFWRPASIENVRKNPELYEQVELKDGSIAYRKKEVNVGVPEKKTDYEQVINAGAARREKEKILASKIKIKTPEDEFRLKLSKDIVGRQSFEDNDKIRALLVDNNITSYDLVSAFIPDELVPTLQKEDFSFKLKITPSEKLELWLFIDKRDELSIARTYDFSQKVVEHGELKLPKKLRAGGLGKKILKQSIDLYDKCGIEKIQLYAGYDIGPYIWAKVGFECIDQLTEKWLIDRVVSLGFNINPKDLHELASAEVTKEDFNEIASKSKSRMLHSRLKKMEKYKCISGNKIKIGKLFLIDPGEAHWYEAEIDLNSKRGKILRRYVSAKA